MKVKKVHRPVSALKRYLSDYAQDRNMVFLTAHKAVVDRLCHTDSRITSWRAWWRQRSGTPYMERRGQFIFPGNTEPSNHQA